MTNFTVWRLCHCSCVGEAAFRIFVQSGYITSVILIEVMQMDLSEDSDLSQEFSCDEFPLENAMLVSCKKDFTSRFVLDPYTCFHYYFRRHFSFVNAYVNVTYPYQSVVIECRGCYRKSIKHIMKSFPVYLK